MVTTLFFSVLFCFFGLFYLFCSFLFLFLFPFPFPCLCLCLCLFFASSFCHLCALFDRDDFPFALPRTAARRLFPPVVVGNNVVGGGR